MTTDELRAKFEAHCAKYARNLSLRRHPERDYWYEETRQAWELWQAANASRDAEVEALRKDAQRMAWLRSRCSDDLCVRKGLAQITGTALNDAIDAAMREESK